MTVLEDEQSIVLAVVGCEHPASGLDLFHTNVKGRDYEYHKLIIDIIDAVKAIWIISSTGKG